MNDPLHAAATSPPLAEAGGDRANGRGPRLSARRLARLARKELREILRDRRTIVTLVLMPLLAYPLLSVAFQQFVFSTAATTDQHWLIGMQHEADAQEFSHRIQAGEGLLLQMRLIGQAGEPPEDGRSSPPEAEGAGSFESQIARGLGAPSDLAELQLRDLEIVAVRDLEAAVREGRIDLGVRRVNVPPADEQDAADAADSQNDNGAPGGGFAERAEEARPLAEFELLFRSDSQRARRAALFVERRFWAVNEQFARERHPDGAGAVAPLTRWTLRAFVSTEASRFLLATLTPLVLILMTITGAVYPAIDLTAGERERGTLEALMATPVSKTAVLCAKYVAVLAVAVLTAAVNLLAMSVTIASTGLGPLLWGEQAPAPAVILQVFALTVLFAAFFSAILLVLTSLARSFKEAQSYLIPLMLLAIGPGFITLMPGLELNSVLCVVPLVNIVLLARDVLQGQAEPLLTGAVAVSTGLYALAALALAARVFGADSVLYGGQAGWSDLLRPAPKPVPTIAGAAVTVALVFPLHMAFSGLLAAFVPEAVEARLIASAGLTVLLFAAFPWLMSRAQAVALRSGFQLRRTGLPALLGAAVLGLSLWPFAHELVMWANRLGISGLPAEQIAGAEHLLAALRQTSPWLILIALAAVPGVCEEWFFRGYLLSAGRGRMPAWAAVGLSAVLFGVFHVFVGSGLAGVRFLPSTALGLALGYVCWTTRSVLPGMLLHVLHNGLLLTAVQYQETLSRWGVGIEQREHLPATWLLTAGTAAAIGFVLIRSRLGSK